jgi:hypothetical protein
MQNLMHIPDRAGAAFPQHLQDFELGFGWTWFHVLADTH